jgi:hypothetical protein
MRGGPSPWRSYAIVVPSAEATVSISELLSSLGGKARNAVTTS